jgi:DNA-binding NarL/FixJ family response regulator
MLEVFQLYYVLYSLPANILVLLITLLVLPIGVLVGKHYFDTKPGDLNSREKPTVPLVVPNDLSKREMEVLEKLCLGYSNQQIADSLHISLATVKSHVSNILIKFNVARRTQLIHACREMGVFPDPTKE